MFWRPSRWIGLLADHWRRQICSGFPMPCSLGGPGRSATITSAVSAWPAPEVDRIEALAAKYAEAWPAWGYRKIAALMRADGHQVANSSVRRALKRRGLLLPQGFRADRKSWAVLRRRVFRDPPTERNRVWQTDFSEFETTNGGI